MEILLSQAAGRIYETRIESISTDDLRTTPVRLSSLHGGDVPTQMDPGGVDQLGRAAGAVAIAEDGDAVAPAIRGRPWRHRMAIEQDGRAEAVAVIPNVVKASFVLGGRSGRGLVSVRSAGPCPTIRNPQVRLSRPQATAVGAKDPGWNRL